MDHPTRVITTRPAGVRVKVRFGGETIADSRRALELSEETHAPVYYLPKDDVRMDLLGRKQPRDPLPLQGRCPLLVDPGRRARGQGRCVGL